MAPTMVGNAGSSQPVAILQPLLCVSFIIALTGIYPSRN
jgi:microcystin-dependent protein